MALTMRLNSDDLVRCRFAVSPLWETQNALRVLRFPHLHPALGGWCGRVRARLADVDVAPLHAVMPRHGYTPDFISAPVHAGTALIADQLAQVRTAPDDLVAGELSRVGEAGTGGARAELPADPASARDLLADRLDDVWSHLIEPDWPQIRDVLEGDVAYRSRRLAEAGLEGVLADMHPAIQWSAAIIRVDVPVHATADLDGRGLVFQPSVFTGPDPVVILDRPWQPTLVYPARGSATLTGPTPHAAPALARLVGSTRARLLLDLSDPASTTMLARRHGLAPSTVSAHLTALHAAGLITKRRWASSVRYAQTPLGAALVAGDVP